MCRMIVCILILREFRQCLWSLVKWLVTFRWWCCPRLAKQYDYETPLDLFWDSTINEWWVHVCDEIRWLAISCGEMSTDVRSSSILALFVSEFLNLTSLLEKVIEWAAARCSTTFAVGRSSGTILSLVPCMIHNESKDFCAAEKDLWACLKLEFSCERVGV